MPLIFFISVYITTNTAFHSFRISILARKNAYPTCTLYLFNGCLGNVIQMENYNSVLVCVSQAFELVAYCRIERELDNFYLPVNTAAMANTHICQHFANPVDQDSIIVYRLLLFLKKFS